MPFFFVHLAVHAGCREEGANSYALALESTELTVEMENAQRFRRSIQRKTEMCKRWWQDQRRIFTLVSVRRSRREIGKVVGPI